MSVDEIFNSSERKMAHAIEALEHHFNTLRTGRASAALLDDIRVDAYGSPVPLNQVASVNTPDARSITVQPWDKNQLGPIEKAILAANIGITPHNDGTLIRLNIPPLTEDRRKELAKKAHAMAEEARVAIRNVRKHSKEEIEKLKKAKTLTEDLAHDATDKLQKITDKWIKKVDESLAKKEKDIMAV